MHSKMPVTRQNHIGTRIFTQSLLIAVILTVVLTSIQLWFDYQKLISSVDDTFNQISESQVDGLSTSLWNFSKPELNAITAGLTNYPYIVYAEIRDGDKVIISQGNKLEEDVIKKTIPLTYKNGSTLENIGELRLQADKKVLYQQITKDILDGLSVRALIMLIVTFILLVLIDRQVFKYLRYASEILNKYEISSLDIPLKVSKPDHNDEIDQLVTAFNKLRMRLWYSIKKQDEIERKHSTLLGNLPGMVYRCLNDKDWTMELVSAGCFDLTGYQTDDLVGNKTISYNDLIIPQDRDGIWDTIQTKVNSDAPFELIYRIKRRDGEIRWVWENGVGIFSDDHTLVALEGFITDINERMQQRRELEAIARVGYALRTVDTREQILSVVLEQTTDLLESDGCMVEFIEPATGDAVVRVTNGVFDGLEGTRFPLDKGLNSYIRETGKPYHNNNAPEDPRFIDQMANKTCQAISGVPLIIQGELIGFLWITRYIPISEKAVQTLASIADITANAIHRVDLFQQTRRRLENLLSLREIDNAINSNTDITKTMDVFLDQVMEQLKVDAVRVMKFDPQSKHLMFLDGKGFISPHYMLPRDVSENTAAGEFVSKMVTIQTNDLNHDPFPPEIEPFIKAEGFQSLFVTPMVVNNAFQGMLQAYLRRPFYPENDWIQFFETLAGQAAIAINESTLWSTLQQSNSDLKIAYDETLAGWSKALDLRDHETENHTQRVIELTMKLAETIGISGDDLVNIRRGALLHDVGKIGVPDSILTKPGKLTAEEWDVMRMHPVNAYNLIYPINYLRDALDIPYCHHEKWDGSGYPRGLKGDEIPLAARIFAFADVWDAMTSDRYYRAALPVEEVREYFLQNRGKHFDPLITDIFLNMMK